MTWSTTTIGEIFDIGAGKTMSSKRRAGDELTPFLRTSNVLWDSVDLSRIDEMPMQPHERADKSLRPGDLLVCEGGEIGRAAVWEGQCQDVSFQNHLHRLRRKTDDIDPGFYVYFLQSAFTQLGIFEGAGNKTTIPNLSRNRLAALEVPKPDYPEQVAIRSVLKRVRAGIATTDDTIERLVELKRATMRELLTRGLRGEPQKETEVGLVPESWELFAVADAVLPFRFDRTKQLQTNRYLPAGQWPIIDQGQKQIAGYTNDEDAIITPSAPIIIFGDHTRTLKFVETPFALGADGTKPLTVREGWNPRYLFHALCNVSVPSRGYNRHFKQFEESIIAKPGTDEQAELAQIFDAIDDKIDLHQRKLTLLGELFRALLHKLMTREIHLSDLDLSALKTEAAA